MNGCDLLIEAVVENTVVKHAVMQRLEPRLAAGGIWATNTSALPIATLSAPSTQPGNVIGLHFFSPVEQMPLLEIVVGPNTTEDTLARCVRLARDLGKLPIVVNDGYGFYTTRVFSAYLLEGVQLICEGHDPAVVEWAARSQGMAVGPLKAFDEVSLTLASHAFSQAGLPPAGSRLDRPRICAAHDQQIQPEMERPTGQAFTATMAPDRSGRRCNNMPCGEFTHGDGGGCCWAASAVGTGGRGRPMSG